MRLRRVFLGITAIRSVIVPQVASSRMRSAAGGATPSGAIFARLNDAGSAGSQTMRYIRRPCRQRTTSTVTPQATPCVSQMPFHGEASDAGPRYLRGCDSRTTTRES